MTLGVKDVKNSNITIGLPSNKRWK